MRQRPFFRAYIILAGKLYRRSLCDTDPVITVCMKLESGELERLVDILPHITPADDILFGRLISSVSRIIPSDDTAAVLPAAVVSAAADAGSDSASIENAASSTAQNRGSLVFFFIPDMMVSAFRRRSGIPRGSAPY